MSTSQPTRTKSASVTVLNLSDHAEIIAAYEPLVALVGETLGTNCPNLTVTLAASNKPLPLTLPPRGKLTVKYDVTFDCANDAAKGAGHEDFEWTAMVAPGAAAKTDVLWKP